VDEERKPQLDRSPEVLGFVADLLVIIAAFVSLGVFRC
jgi:hypothetical protein